MAQPELSQRFSGAAFYGRAIALILLYLLIFWLYRPMAAQQIVRGSDRFQYAAIAFNLARYGVFSERELSTPEEALAAPFYYRREPAVPAFLAAFLLADRSFAEGLPLSCFNREGCEEAFELRRRINRALYGLAALLVVTALPVTALVTGSRVAAWFSALVLFFAAPSLVRFGVQEVLGALLLLAHSAFAFRALSSARYRQLNSAGAAVFLGLLSLTKAVFFYWLLLLAAGALALVVFAPFLGRRVDRTSLLLFSFLAVLTVGTWVQRNARGAGKFAVTGRGGECAAIRAEFSLANRNVFRAMFAAFSPDEPPFLKAYFRSRTDEETLSLLDRKNPRGFYRRVRNFEGEVSRRAERLDASYRETQMRMDSALGKAAAELIRENLLAHLVLTVPFAYRGAFVQLHNFHDARKKWPSALYPVVNTLRRGLLYLRILFLPIFVGLFVYLLWKGSFAEVGFFASAAAAYAAQALTTHFIPRFASVMAPELTIGFAFACCLLWRACRYSRVLKNRFWPISLSRENAPRRASPQGNPSDRARRSSRR